MKTKKLLLIFALIFLWANFTLEQTSENTVSNSFPPSEITSLPYYDVLKVIDGDTIKINYNGEPTTVRFLQVDTPESRHPNPNKNVPMGKIAAKFTKDIIGNKPVQIAFDTEKTDNYGRFLCYVYVEGKCINEELLRSGMAMVISKKPNIAKTDEYKKLQEEVQKNKIGIWKNIQANYPHKNISDELFDNSSETEDFSSNSKADSFKKKKDSLKLKKKKKK